MSTFVVVPGAWDTPATMEPLLEPLGSAGHAVTVVDLPCERADATLQDYADAMRAALPDVPLVYLAAWIPRERYALAADPSERDAVRAYLERTQRPQGIVALRETWQGALPASISSSATRSGCSRKAVIGLDLDDLGAHT